MLAIRSFSELTGYLQEISTRRRLVVINPSDKHTQEAILKSDAMGMTDTIIIGNPDDYNKEIFIENPRFRFISCKDLKTASELGVELVKSGEADILMKGLVNTDVVLKAVINKETGIVPFGNVVTFIAAMEIPDYHKLLFVTDPAVIPSPNLRQRTAMIEYSIDFTSSLGIQKPKIALIHGTEKMNPKLCYMNDYQAILDQYQSGTFGDAIIAGPLDLFLALDYKSGSIKQVNSTIQGDADVLIFPGFESANIFYKSMMTFAGAQMGGVLYGTTKPVVLTSRSDNTESKFNSIALACLLNSESVSDVD
jgi:phosphate butyryltransferase